MAKPKVKKGVKNPVTAVRDGNEKVFQPQQWNLMPDHKNGWIPVPKTGAKPAATEATKTEATTDAPAKEDDKVAKTTAAPVTVKPEETKLPAATAVGEGAQVATDYSLGQIVPLIKAMKTKKAVKEFFTGDTRSGSKKLLEARLAEM